MSMDVKTQETPTFKRKFGELDDNNVGQIYQGRRMLEPQMLEPADPSRSNKKKKTGKSDMADPLQTQFYDCPVKPCKFTGHAKTMAGHLNEKHDFSSKSINLKCPTCEETIGCSTATIHRTKSQRHRAALEKLHAPANVVASTGTVEQSDPLLPACPKVPLPTAEMQMLTDDPDEAVKQV